MHRALLQWEWFTEPTTAHLFVYCLLRANHTNTQWRGIPLTKGQFVFGRSQASVDTGLSEQQIRTALDRLKSTGEITSNSTNKYTIITVTNWEKYQGDNQQDNQQVTSQQPAINHRQECNNDKNVRSNAPAPAKVSLDELSVEHISEWLMQKRTCGKYLMHDEHFILDYFKNYCQSKGKRYADYIAAYRNAFEWTAVQPTTVAGQQSKYDRAKAAALRGLMS